MGNFTASRGFHGNLMMKHNSLFDNNLGRGCALALVGRFHHGTDVSAGLGEFPSAAVSRFSRVTFVTWSDIGCHSPSLQATRNNDLRQLPHAAMPQPSRKIRT
jgi:hypothetical protein